MKKMIVLLAAMMMAMSVSVWAADEAAPGKAEAVAPAKTEAAAPAKVEAKPADKHKKPTEKMRGGNCDPHCPNPPHRACSPHCGIIVK